MKKLLAAVIAAFVLVPGAAFADAPHDQTFRDEKGKIRHTHGPDRVPRVQLAGAPNYLMDTYDVTSNAGKACVDDTIAANKRVRFVLAVPSDYNVANEASDRSRIETQANNIAAKTWAELRARPKMGCVNNGGPSYTWPLNITKVTVSSCTLASCDFPRIANAVRSTLGSDVYRKYVVFYANTLPGECGRAEVVTDSSPNTTTNLNVTTPGMVAVAYQTLSYDETPPNVGYRTCWESGAALHEALHILGAVQPDAPHGTAAHHCYQGVDIMCYDDGTLGGNVLTQTCTDRVWIDCSTLSYRDDYARYFGFAGAGAPPAGSYAATHWLVTSSGFFTTQFPV